MVIEEYWNKDFLKWFKENTPKEGLSENTTFSKQFVYDAYVQGRVDEDNSNEWRYVKDGDLPKNTRYVWTNIGAGYHDDDGWWDDYGRLQGVVAWCEPIYTEE